VLEHHLLFGAAWCHCLQGQWPKLLNFSLITSQNIAIFFMDSGLQYFNINILFLYFFKFYFATQRESASLSFWRVTVTHLPFALQHRCKSSAAFTGEFSLFLRFLSSFFWLFVLCLIDLHLFSA